MLENIFILSLLLTHKQELTLEKLSSQSFKESVASEISTSVTGTLVAQQEEIPPVEERGVVFKYLGCETIPGASSPLTCEFLIENQSNRERRFELYAYASGRSFSRVVDSNGNEISASLVELGDSSSERVMQMDLSDGVPMRVRVSFEAVPDGGIRLIDLGCYLYGSPNGGSFSVEFKDF
ncbi:MAG: hypothetical protein AAF193_08500 [Bacteroidota bacterium]